MYKSILHFVFLEKKYCYSKNKYYIWIMKTKITKTRVCTLSKEEIQEACYDAYVKKFKDLGMSIWFDASDVKLNSETIECKLTIIEWKTHKEENEKAQVEKRKAM